MCPLPLAPKYSRRSKSGVRDVGKSIAVVDGVALIAS